MGIFQRLLRRSAPARRGDAREIGPTEADIQALRRALLEEARRLGRERQLALTLFMEHTTLNLAGIDLFAVLGHLKGAGEITNVVEDSIGNLKFDLTETLKRRAGDPLE